MRMLSKKWIVLFVLPAILALVTTACGDDEAESSFRIGVMESATGAGGTYGTVAVQAKPESTEGRPWGQPLKKPAGAPLNLG